VQVVAAADRADLTGREEPGDAVDGELLGQHRRIVLGSVEHQPAAAVAGEQQGALDRDEVARGPEALRAAAQVVVGRPCVADLELHGATDRDEVADDQTVPLLVDPADGPDEEVALTGVVGVVVHRDAELQPA